MFIDSVSEEIIDKVTKIFGVLSVVPAEISEKNIDDIGIKAIEQLKNLNRIKHSKWRLKEVIRSFPTIQGCGRYALQKCRKRYSTSFRRY